MAGLSSLSSNASLRFRGMGRIISDPKPEKYDSGKLRGVAGRGLLSEGRRPRSAKEGSYGGTDSARLRNQNLDTPDHAIRLRVSYNLLRP